MVGGQIGGFIIGVRYKDYYWYAPWGFAPWALLTMSKRMGSAAKAKWVPQPGNAVRAKFKSDKPPPRFCAKWEGKGSFFCGSVVHVHEDDGSCDIMFNDGFFETRVLRTCVQRAQHRVLRQWQRSGHPLIGARLRREHIVTGHQHTAVTLGTVVCWCPASPPTDEELSWPMMFHCVHDDDDEESLTMAEVQAGVQALAATPCTAPTMTEPLKKIPRRCQFCKFLQRCEKCDQTSKPPPVAAADTLALSAVPTQQARPVSVGLQLSDGAAAAPSRPAAAAPAPLLASADMTGVEGVREVLRRIRLDQYFAAFESEGFDDLYFLRKICAHASAQPQGEDHDAFEALVAAVHLKPGHAQKLADCLPRIADEVLGV